MRIIREDKVRVGIRTGLLVRWEHKGHEGTNLFDYIPSEHEKERFLKTKSSLIDEMQKERLDPAATVIEHKKNNSVHIISA